MASQAGIEYLDVARAVHGLHRVLAVLRLREKHVLAEVVPMPRALPQRNVEYRRTAHFLESGVAVDPAHVLLDLLPQRPALRMPEHHARRFVLHMEEVERAPKLAVIALLRFFEAMQVGFLV